MGLTRRDAIIYSIVGLAALFFNRSDALAKTSKLNSIYVPSWKLVSKKNIDKYLNMISNSNINALMIDTKDAHGYLYFSFNNSLANKINSYYKTADGTKRTVDLEYLLNSANKKNIDIIARHVMFRDKKLYENVSSFRSFFKSKKEKWVDLLNEGVISYNLDILNKAVKLGFNHIVLDYIRFPATSKCYKISLDKKCDIIDEIVKKVKQNIKTTLGVQIFGYAALDYRKAGVGQRISSLQEYVDYIYPMVYPSHFWTGSFGFKNPSDHPYKVIENSYISAISKIRTHTKIVPMIQAFNYSAKNISRQLQAVKDNKIPGYACWNPSGNYSKLFLALKLI